jgi:tRNA (cytidine(34)-2'-O)-methyltransferase
VLLPETEQFLMSLDWPGNVRQLENTCRWLTVMASGREIHLADLPPELGRAAPRTAPMTRTDWQTLLPVGAQRTGQRQAAHPARGVPAIERSMIEVALAHTRGRKRDAAELLGWGRNTLTRKMKELGMDGVAMLHIGLYEPEIPPNTGNIMRLCANTGCPLHLVKPLGFSLDDRQLRRAGLDYRDHAEVAVHDSMEALLEAVAPGRCWTLSTRGSAATRMRLTATATCCCSARKRGACPRNSSTTSEEGSCLRIPCYRTAAAST